MHACTITHVSYVTICHGLVCFYGVVLHVLLMILVVLFAGRAYVFDISSIVGEEGYEGKSSYKIKLVSFHGLRTFTYNHTHVHACIH